MAAAISQNRQMFWRIVRRMLSANRGRLFVMLLALGSGAAVTAALLNLQVDAKRRLTREFRAFGANVLVLPKTTSGSDSATLPESVTKSLPTNSRGGPVTAVSDLYLVASIRSVPTEKQVPTVVVGKNPFAFLTASVRPMAEPNSATEGAVSRLATPCVVGENAARELKVKRDEPLRLTSGNRTETCQVVSLTRSGGPEDDRVEIGLPAGQRLANLPGRISALEVTVPGTPNEIQSYIRDLQRALPGAEVRPIRQITEGQAKIYGRISGLLTATVFVVLALTSLCVMAAMTNVAMERKNDVGLMKAIGGATRRVLRLFLMEAVLMGIAGGLIGAAAGILLSIWLGKQVFGVAAQPRLIVYPVAVALTILVAIMSAFPLRRLAGIRPASVFRGEA